MSKSYGQQWTHKSGIIRQRGARFQAEVNWGRRRIRETKATLAEARTWIEQTLTELKNEGIAAQSLTTDDRIDAAKAKQLLPKGTSLEEAVKGYAAAVSRLENASLDEAVAFYLRHHRPVGGPRTVTELLQEYLNAKEKLGRRPATVQDIAQRVRRFAESFGERHVHTITAADIDAWLDKERYCAQSRLNYMTVLCGFFSYARRLGLIESNPADREHLERPRMDEHLPETFTVASVEILLTVAIRTAPRIVPYLAVGFFAGLRTSELDGLEWSGIDLDQRLITVRPETAKRRRQRHVDISDNLLAWLQQYRQTAGRLRPENARNQIDGVIKAAGVKWVHNGMRHTFASCHLVLHNDISRTCIQLGHTGNPSVLFNHYRNLVKPAEAEAYWRIMPPQKDGVATEFPNTA